ncbi:penicillin-binding protein 1A [Flavobacterium limicola]|jgi:membrane carboxypeptidase/penicillin-binding protein|uniref:Penicillin-binding protein 1A n=2 Tax=Flavobacterium limicola TaxID=180441 RepID=A0A495S516_9FLAO|nr:penicillin-binding protein 1A [Flavobacterium limicola]
MSKLMHSYRKDWNKLKEIISNETIKIEIIKDDVSINKLIDYLISAEDHRYKYHVGFDIIAIIRAFRNRILYKKQEGASTIEQQLVRTIIGKYEKSLSRKLREICLAFALKLFINKKTTALIYLNIAYYGTDFKGLDKVLKKFNLKKGDYINDNICAEIVSRLKYPESTKKSTRLKLIENRKKYLLKLYEKHSNYKLLKIHG